MRYLLALLLSLSFVAAADAGPLARLRGAAARVVKRVPPFRGGHAVRQVQQAPAGNCAACQVPGK